jgi:hypothetical protein
MWICVPIYRRKPFFPFPLMRMVKEASSIGFIVKAIKEFLEETFTIENSFKGKG